MTREEILAAALRDHVKDKLQQSHYVVRRSQGVTVNGQDTPGVESYVEIAAPPVHVTNEVAVPAVSVTNEVAAPIVNVTAPQVVVNVDTDPLARALALLVTPLTAAVSALVDANAGLRQLIGQLGQRLEDMVEVVREQPAPVFSPNVVAAPPKVIVRVPEQLERPRRSLTITHDDGTTSRIEES